MRSTIPCIRAATPRSAAASRWARPGAGPLGRTVRALDNERLQAYIEAQE